MKTISILFILLFCVSVSAQVNNYQNIQGNWICITSQYKNHIFWVKGTSFFQNFEQGVLEQRLPYQIEKSADGEIEIIGLFVKCKGCFDDVWTISQLTSTKLILINYDTEETVEYKKAVKTKSKK